MEETPVAEVPPEFDLNAPAELFSGYRNHGSRKRAIAYRRFDTLAEAITFAIGPGRDALNLNIETELGNLDRAEIVRLSESEAFLALSIRASAD